MALRRKLMPHQRDALQKTASRPGAAFFMEMRLGKTLAAIRWAMQFELESYLVVCPLSVIHSWKKELAAEGLSCVALTGDKNEKQGLLERHKNPDGWYITNYEALIETGHKTRSGKPKVVSSFILNYSWECAILDESTRIKNPKSLTTKNCMDKLYQIPFKAVLSGLPNPEGPEDFVTQMIFTFGTFMGCEDFWQWRARHMQQYGPSWVVKRKAIGQVRAEVQERAFVLTRQDAGMGSKKVYEQRRVKLPQKCYKAIEQLREHYELPGRMTKDLLVTLTWEQQIAGGCYSTKEVADLTHNAKVNELIYLIQGELKNEPLLIWCRFTAEISLVKETLTKKGVRVEAITGDTAPDDRASSVERFQSGGFKILIMQTRCMQMGIDLSTASTAIYYSNYFDYEVRAQSEDRVIHPRKHEPVLLVDLVAEGTIDEDVVSALISKRMDSRVFLRRLFSKVRKRYT